MSRSEYSDECSGSESNLWRGAVDSALRGKRGQAFLRETLAALDAMPEKKLTKDSLHEPVSGEFCTLGAVGLARSMDLRKLEYAEPGNVAKAFGISRAMAAEIMFVNDDENDWHHDQTPEHRWNRMRSWVVSHIKTEAV